MEKNCDYHRLELPDEEPLKELKSMLFYTFKNKQVSMWGIPINMESSDDASETAKADVILLKFLKAKNSRVQDAYKMLIKSLEWRKAYGADSILEQDLGFKTLENRVCYNMGCDRQGCPISYTNYSDFFEAATPMRCFYEQTSLYKEIFSIYENQEKFIRWRIQVIERLIRMLSFKPGEVNSIVLVQDYKHTDFKHRFSRPLIDVNQKILSILRDNYPGMISYKILLNVPWIVNTVFSLRSLFNGNESIMCKLVISDEASVPETLYKYISPEHIPQLYGGIYGTDDNLKTVPVSGIMAKGGETFTIKIEGIKAHATVWWDVVAGGSYFEYSFRFVPDEEARLAKMVQNPVKEKRVSYCYTAKEAGKIVISIHSRVTKLVSYRYKVQNLKV